MKPEGSAATRLVRSSDDSFLTHVLRTVESKPAQTEFFAFPLSRQLKIA